MGIFQASAASLIGAAFYGLVAIVCLVAHLSQGIRNKTGPETKFWFWAALVMTVLVVVRVLSLEELARTELRSAFENLGLIEQRRTYQIPALALAILVFVSSVYVIAVRFRRRMRAVQRSDLAQFVATLALLGLATLFGIRIVSLHAADSVLYYPIAGPVRLSWILDIGLAAIVGGGAVFQWYSSRQRRK